MKPEVYMGLNAMDKLEGLYPLAQFHIWHIPELDDQLLCRITSYLGGRVASRNVYQQGMPNLSEISKYHRQFSEISKDPNSVILGIGGGSLMDFSKVIRFSAIDDDWFSDSLDRPFNELPLDCIRHPLVLMPTTAGTGSEVTGTATIWDFQKRTKHSFFGEQVYADYAIVDPQLCVGAPWELTRDSALDALSHALESIWNKNATDETRQWAVKASRQICLHLQDLQVDIHNMDARLALSNSALLAGLAMAKTQTALAHALSYEDTLNTRLSHGYACGTWLPLVWQLVLNSGNQAVAKVIQQAVGDYFASPEEMLVWLKKMGVAAHDPCDIKTDIQLRIDRVKQSPRGKNFVGFDHQPL